MLRSATSKSALLLASLLCVGHSGAQQTPAAPGATATPVVTQALAGIPGKETLLVTVDYPPGVASAPHRHNANTIVYVLEGTVVMGVGGGKEVTLTKGQTFYESPTDVHTVSRNASATQPARILAILIKDIGAPATVPAN
jgi:quercetin dioxygenase-like cupin family protein